jgi:hypothetical protein
MFGNRSRSLPSEESLSVRFTSLDWIGVGHWDYLPIQLGIGAGITSVQINDKDMAEREGFD